MEPLLSAEQISTLDIWMIIPLFIVGSLLHFVYNWSRHNKDIAIVAAVNESYWEHIKIAFWPVFALYLTEFILGGYALASFVPSRTVALYAIPVTMVATVFLYKQFVKKNILWVDIFLFLFTIAVAQLISHLLIGELEASLATILLSFAFLCAIVIAFLAFTKRPPKEPDIFKDPLTKKYGLKGHK